MIGRKMVGDFLVKCGKSRRADSRFESVFKNKILSNSKRSQVSAFIIIALVIVAGIGVYFAFRSDLIKVSVPLELEPVYNYYLSCIEAEVLAGAGILGQQGGYIENPDFSPGSEYMPFSNQLDFLGIGVPYWYYISGNGVVKEQKPSKEKMESQLNNFLEEQDSLCDFSEFEEKGFVISIGDLEAETGIKDGSIDVDVKQDLSIKYGDTNWNGKSHSVDARSNLGGFYKLAEEIYLKNKEEMFLENYGVDVLRLYSPVDGVEIGCGSQIWSVDEIRDDLINALEANVHAIKVEGDYYKLSKSENKYFVQDLDKAVNGANVNFMYSRTWPMKMEVWPNEDGVLRADPIGLQEGLGMLGFCYVPYHFVYDLGFPVMIQIYAEGEMFQFPVVVYVDKNKPREALDVEGLPKVVPELCEKKITELIVYTYDTELNSVEADINFKCFDTSCDIGETVLDGEDAVLTAKFPQCVNGYIVARAEGYETEKYLVSSIEESSAILVLDKKYEMELEINKGGGEVGGEEEHAVVTFSKKNKTRTVAYPEQKLVDLTEGQYEIKVYVYSDSDINLKGDSLNKCVDVPKSGVLGVFGFNEEKCFAMDIPDQVVSAVVSGGGKQSYYIAESELRESDKLIIDAKDFGVPTKVEDLQINYNGVEVSGLDVRFE